MLSARLPLFNKLLYAADMVGSQAVSQARNLWLLFFLAPPIDKNLPVKIPGLDLGFIDLEPRVFVGILLAAGRIIEAFDDPIIGWWSDRTRSRWGRRLPFVVLGTPFYAAFFALLWMNPSGDASFGNAVYLFIVLEMFFLASTISGGPYEALIPEITRTDRERLDMVGWQFYFGILGAVLGLVFTGLIKDAAGFVAMGIIIAIFGLAFRYLGVVGVWRYAPRTTTPARLDLKEAIVATLRNKQFVYFLPTFVLFQLSVGMVIAWLPFFVQEVLQKENEGAFTSVLTGVSLVAMLISAYVMWQLGKSKGKRWVYSISLLGSAVIMPLLIFAGFLPGIPKLVQGGMMSFLVGLPMAGVFLLPKAITADITDYDELRTGVRREGMFYAIQNLFEKVGSSFAPLVLAVVLLLGETSDDPLGIRLVGPVAGVFAFLGFWLFRAYSLPSTVTLETVRAANLEV